MMLIKRTENNKQQEIQPKLSTIFKQKVIDIPQAFGSFYDVDGEKYCAVSVLLKYLGYDIAAVSKKTQKDKNINLAESIPYTILEKIENFVVCDNHEENLKCFCSRPDYYCYSLISSLIHLNDYHKMTFSQIGSWLESKDM